MPHFKVKQLQLPKLPFKALNGEFEFLECFTSTKNPNFALLLVKFHNANYKIQEFFLEIRYNKNEVLVRFDKYSRIAPIEITKTALRILMELQTNTITHNLNHNSIPLESKLPFIKNIYDFINGNVFENFKEIWLEIGFGSGRHLLHNAQNNKEILHIGLEIHHPSLEQVARQIGLLDLKNLWILAYDARIFLELLPSNCLDRIFVHFPVPWDKKPHRRIFSQAFLTQSLRILKQNAILQLRTDSLEYFLFAKNLATTFKDFKIQSTTNAKEAIISKYEARWLREEKNIYNLELTALLSSIERKLNFNFDFLDSKIRDFKPIKCIKEDYFLHIEEFMRGDSNTLLRITFGDFNYPQTRYILQKPTMHYFRENPLPTQINHKAHNLLLNLLSKESQ